MENATKLMKTNYIYKKLVWKNFYPLSWKQQLKRCLFYIIYETNESIYIYTY